MGVDRWIRWKEDEIPEWGRPDIDRVAATARDFLGPNWEVRISEKRNWIVCESKEKQTFHLRSEYERQNDDYSRSHIRAYDEMYKDFSRGFEICFFGEHGEEQFSIITRQCDRYTDAIANELTRVLAQWFGGDVDWPS